MRDNRRTHLVACLVIVLLLVPGVACMAQEVGSLDLTQVEPRLELRRPPPRNDQASRAQNGGRVVYPCDRSGGSIGTFRVTLVGLDRSEYQAGDQQRFQVRIENVGQAPLTIPFSPHLADLQPEDAGQKFAYSQMMVQVWMGGSRWSATMGAGVSMYAAKDRPETWLTLNPGEWVRVTGQGRIILPRDGPPVPLDDPVSRATARLWLADNETLLTASESATVSHEVCLSQTQGPSLPIRLTGAD